MRSGGRASPRLVDFCPLLAILLDTERIHPAVELRRHPSLFKVHIKSVTVAGRHDCRLTLLKKENMGLVSIIWLLCSDCLWDLLSKSWMSLTNHYVSKKVMSVWESSELLLLNSIQNGIKICIYWPGEMEPLIDPCYLNDCVKELSRQTISVLNMC